jgi:steroid delta-isomerase-like uncharacterized protein
MQVARSLIQRIFDQAFNQGDLAVVDELVAVGGVSRTTSWGMPAGRMGLKQWIAALRLAFPDLHCTVEDEICEQDKVAAHWTMYGTHWGPFLGNPPTGRPITVQGIIFARIANGQIVENWTLVDQMSMLQQLGIVPPPHNQLVRG